MKRSGDTCLIKALKVDVSATQDACINNEVDRNDVINFLNAERPSKFMYPVSDIQVEPISAATAGYVSWVKKQTGKDAGFELDEEEKEQEKQDGEVDFY